MHALAHWVEEAHAFGTESPGFLWEKTVISKPGYTITHYTSLLVCIT